MAAGGSTLVEARMPLDAASFAELGARLLAYAAGVALLVLGRAAGSGSGFPLPSRWASQQESAPRCSSRRSSREVLKWAWAWIPAGALIALVVLLRRRRLDSRAPV